MPAGRRISRLPLSAQLGEGRLRLGAAPDGPRRLCLSLQGFRGNVVQVALPHRRAVAIAALACFAAGCVLRARTPVLVHSGFLSDYSVLEEAGDERAQLLYRNPETDFGKYDKIMFERVTIWVAHAEDTEKLAADDFEHLADSMYSTIHAALEDDYELVHEPGPGVLRIELSAESLKRYGTNAEVAALALFLGSDESSFSTGTIFTLDGGSNAA